METGLVCREAAGLQSALALRLGLGGRTAARPANARTAASPHPQVLSLKALARSEGCGEGKGQRLSEGEWRGVEGALAGRRERACPICMQPFARDARELLLSCSHSFHQACLAAFERVCALRRCPVCRAEGCSSRPTRAGSAAHRWLCALSIQGAWRALVARRELLRRRRELYRAGGGEAGRRRAFLGAELRRGAAEAAVSEGAIDREARAVLEASSGAAREGRLLDVQFAAMLRERAARVILFPPSEEPLAEETEERWAGRLALFLTRSRGECAICMGALGERQACSWRRAVLLSCAHGEPPFPTPQSSVTRAAFHDKCVRRLEVLGEGEAHAKCPCCRAAYSKRLLALDGAHFI